MNRIVKIIIPVLYFMGGSAATIVLAALTGADSVPVPKNTANVIKEEATEQLDNKEKLVIPTAYSDKSMFSFSPDQKQIAYIQNVFSEYGEDYDRHYAVQIFDVVNRKEKRIFVGDYKIATVTWLSSSTLRIYRNAGTGVRGYHDLTINQAEPLILKEYIANNPGQRFWQNDREYEQKASIYELAEATYRELTAGDSAF